MKSNKTAEGLASDVPHRRLNILTGEWVLVSPHRSSRPWQELEVRQAYDSECYLCAGNTRISGKKNPDYQNVYSFVNDHAAIIPLEKSFENSDRGLLHARSESGCCKVVCFSPRHDLTLAEMEVEGIYKVVELWQQEYCELGERDDINYVQIFENKGSVMGCSNPHPHGQIWAQESVPNEPALELANMRRYSRQYGRPLLMDYADLEMHEQCRIVCENDAFLVVVPYWATWPSETLILPKEQISSIKEMSKAQVRAYAEIIKLLTVKYDNLFETSFPYLSGIHQAPVDGGAYLECTFHMHFYPPLLRSATIKKFMVGYEMLGGAQRDMTPEKCAELLRNTSDVHYKEKVEAALKCVESL